MRFSRYARHYWPLLIVTGAICLGMPFTGSRQQFESQSQSQSQGQQQEQEQKSGAGFSRPQGALPFFGFDGVDLEKQSVEKLRELNANTVLLGPIWADRIQQDFEDSVERLRKGGLKVIVEVSDTHDWVVGKEFFVKKATRVLAQARNQGVGDLADIIIVEGDAVSFANHEQRQRLYRTMKEYFPNTPIARRYGESLEWAEAMHGKPHPMGGTWDDYRFGADECDVALISVGRGVPQGQAGVKIDVVLEQLNHSVALVKSRQPEVAVLVGAQFGEARALESSKGAMWSAKEIDQFVAAVLTSSEVEGLLFKGLGSYKFDLAHPDFTAQREAFRQAAPTAPSISVGAATRGLASDRH